MQNRHNLLRRLGVKWPLLALPLLGLFAGAAAASTASDLVVAEVHADRTTARAGEQIAVSARVTNAGGLEAGASRLKYYFSTDERLDATDSYLNYDNVPALPAGASDDEAANVRVPAGTPDGSFFVLVVADFDGAVLELDEWNNTAALGITVGDAALGQGPDLVVADVLLGSARARAGEVVSSACRVANVGAGAASVESRLKYYLSYDTRFDGDDAYLNYDAVDALAPGAESLESASLRVPAGTADGLYYVLFVADETGVIAEVDEENVVALPLLVGDAEPRAELVLEDVSIPTPEVRAGETLAVSATVRNTGMVEAPGSRLVYLLSTDTIRDAGDRQLSYDSVDRLAPLRASPEDAMLRVTAATPAGAYYLLFVVDADDTVAEADETNDVVAVPIAVVTDDPTADKPDLVLEGASLEVSGAEISASVTVANRGVVGSSESRLKYYLSSDAVFDADDTYLNYDNVGALAVGGVSFETANLPLGADVGDAYVLLVVDANDDVAERYESNNVIALPLVGNTDPAGPIDHPDAIAPDLMVTSVAVDSVEVSAGARASLRCVVENVGEHPAAASRLKYYLSRDARFDETDDYVGYDNVPALAPTETSDESVTPLVPATTSHGRWYLLAVADAASEVPETFESNNVAAVAIEVTVDDPTLDAPDLVATSPVLDRYEVGAGRKLDLTVWIQNLGTVASAPARVKLYLSRDGIHDDADDYLAYRDVGGLSVGAATERAIDVRVPMTSAPGLAYLLVVVDSERAVTERYESNNLLAIPITIGDDATAAPPYPYACPVSVFTDPSLLGQHTVATLNALHLGYSNQKDMVALACIASHFDLLGLEEVEDPQGVLDLEQGLEALTGESWSSHVSDHPVGNANGMEFYGYVWRDAEVSLITPRGFYDDPGDLIKREPYGADFRMGAFDFTYVLFHLQYGQTVATRRFEASQLANVYAYFQARNGSESDVLIGGDFNLAADDSAFTLIGVDRITFVTDPEQSTSIGTGGLAHSFDNIFYSSTFTRELVGSGAHDYTMANWAEVLETVTDHVPVWAAFDTSTDDD